MAAAIAPSRTTSAERLHPRSQALGGMLVRRERWTLTWRAWLTLATGAGLVLVGGMLAVHPFLAVTDRVETRILVVEGWVNPYAIKAAAREYATGNYDLVISTGTPVVGLGGYVNDFQTAASVGADQLRSAGVPAERVRMAVSRESGRDRTYSSALALRDWLARQDRPVAAFNVLTEGVHARRTRLLYQTAFGRAVTVGVVAVDNPDYDAAKWWRYSQGVRDVLSETAAYFYAKFLFHPPSPPPLPSLPSS